MKLQLLLFSFLMFFLTFDRKLVSGDFSQETNISCPDDSLALVAFYNALNGDGWVKNTNWKTNAPISTWHGVTTDGNGCVQKIYLDSNKLSGVIPAAIGNLTGLQELVLVDNSIQGRIPDEISNLSQLYLLLLESNQISDPNFNSINAMQSMAFIDFDYNSFTDQSLPNNFCGNDLLQLSLVSTNLKGEIPIDLNCHINLNYLSLKDNQITGNIPPSLGQLTRLVGLQLHMNNLEGQIPKELGNLVGLDNLYLCDNPLLEGSIPNELSQLKNLSAICLSSTNISGSIPSFIGDFKRLKYLWIGITNLSGTIPASLANLDSIQEINFYLNKFDSLPDLSGIGDSLKYFDVENNRLTFDDLLPNRNIAPIFGYENQDSIFNDTTYTLRIGNNFVLDLNIDKGVNSNTYYWTKDGNPIDTTTTSILRRENITSNDAGVYQCEVVNSILTKLTLHSRPVKLIVNEKIEETTSYNFLVTPNADNINEVLSFNGIVDLGQYPKHSIIIVNRYGNTVYQVAPYLNDWGGTYKGNTLSSGTYYYVLELGDENRMMGYITLLTEK